MLILKALLLAFGLITAAGAGIVLLFGLSLAWRRRSAGLESPKVPWRSAADLLVLGALVAASSRGVIVVPAGQAGVRVSQLSGVLPGTLGPGTHLLRPLEDYALYDMRDHVAMAAGESLRAQSKEGLGVGLSVAVRYRLDPQRLAEIHERLPQPIEQQLVEPVVASAFRELVPGYMVREVFATERETIRARAAATITKRLAADGILVSEVMLRDVVLPAEYARGLEGLLLMQQQNERMVFDIEIKQKQVRTAELEAEAQKARSLKQAESEAQARVLKAKGEADAMQYTLPLKQKEIEQKRLEAQARKEAMVLDAQGAAEAKVIDARAEMEKKKLIAEGDAERTRVMAIADGERLRREGEVLKQNPLLIQKIVAEKLSDKMQIMMVPMDGKDFFASNIFRSGLLPAPPALEAPEPPTEPQLAPAAASKRAAAPRLAASRKP